MPENILGIDVSKEVLSVALLSNDTYKHTDIKNDKSGFAKLCTWLESKGLNEVEVCSEATGTYGDGIADFMYSLGHIVRVINPLQIKSFAKAKLSRHKTDKVDASLIAEYGAKFESICYEPLAEDRKELRALYRCTQDLKEQITYCVNHLENENALSISVRDVWYQTKSHYEDQLRALSEKILNIIKAKQELELHFNNLCTIKGVGRETAIAVLAELPRIDSFNSARELAAYVGLTPKHHSSGSSICKRPKISKMGLSGLRKALFFPTMSAMRFNEYFRQFAERLEKAGKAKKVIICAVMRKLIHVIFGILKNKEIFKLEKLSEMSLSTNPHPQAQKTAIV